MPFQFCHQFCRIFHSTAKLQEMRKNRNFVSFASFAVRFFKNRNYFGKTKNGDNLSKIKYFSLSFSFAEFAKLLKKTSESSFAGGYIYLRYIYTPGGKTNWRLASALWQI